MSSWDDRLESAAIWSHLGRLETKLSKAREQVQEDGNGDALTAVERLDAVREYVERALSETDAFLVSQQTLANLASGAQNAEQHVDQFLDSGDPSHITIDGGDKNAAYYGDRLMIFVHQLPRSTSVEHVQGLRDSVTRFRHSAGQLMHYLEKDAEEARELVKQAISEAQDEVETFKQSATASINEVKTEAEQSQQAIQSQAEERLANLKKDIEHQDQRISDALERFNTQFTSSQEDRSSTFGELIENQRQQLQATTKEFRRKGKSFVSAMEEDREEVETLMGIIGASGRARGFERQADYERWASYGWRALAVFAMAGIVWAAWWLAMEAIGASNYDWSQIAAKLTLLGAIGVLAGYAVRQGREHLQRAQINRQLQLELTSINPYLAGFPDEKQQEIKERMVDRWFGNLPSFSASDDDLAPRNSWLQEMQQMVTDAVKRGLSDE